MRICIIYYGSSIFLNSYGSGFRLYLLTMLSLVSWNIIFKNSTSSFIQIDQNPGQNYIVPDPDLAKWCRSRSICCHLLLFFLEWYGFKCYLPKHFFWNMKTILFWLFFVHSFVGSFYVDGFQNPNPLSFSYSNPDPRAIIHICQIWIRNTVYEDNINEWP